MTAVTSALILSVSALMQSPKVEGDPALYELLRDAQATNAARFQSGKMTASVDVSVDGDQARFVEDIEWSGADFRASYRIFDPTGFIEGTRYPEQDLAKAPRHRLLVAGNNVYGYSLKANAVYISDSKKTTANYFELAPEDSWFRLSPPLGRSGRPWVEMIGIHPAFPTRNIESYSIARDGADLIKLTRRDYGGSVVETTFSVGSCMNVVKFVSIDRDGSQSTWGEYRWRSDPSGACVLDEMEFKESASKKPERAESRYRLRVDSIDFKRPVEPARLTLASFVSDLKNVKVYDRETQRTTFLNVKPPETTKDLSGIADKVRERGFANPKP